MSQKPILAEFNISGIIHEVRNLSQFLSFQKICILIFNKKKTTHHFSYVPH